MLSQAAFRERLSMYETYWQLKQKPFENAADPRFYYPSESHQAALLKLRYAIENRRGGALLAGPVRLRKNPADDHAARHPGRAFHAVGAIWCFPRCRRPSCWPIWPTNWTAAIRPPELPACRRASAASSVPGRQQREGAPRGDRHRRGPPARGRHTFEALRLLLNFEPGGAPALTLLLVGQPAILPTLDRMPQWEERLGVKCLLRPFSEPETAGYVEHRLRVAGATRPIVDPDALPDAPRA